MPSDEDMPPERLTLILLLATFLFVGGLRAFLSSVYDQNLTDLGLNGDAPDDVYWRVAAQHRDVWVATGHDANDTAGYTYEAWRPDQRIDYIFISGGIEAISAKRIDGHGAKRASDHLPVMADLRVVP